MTDKPFRGQEPGSEPVPSPPAHPRLGQPEEIYPYVNDAGEPVFYVCRFKTKDGKDFRQGHFGPRGGWRWDLKGIEPLLYRWDEVAAHLSDGSAAPLYICEGEKDADRLRDYLRARGLPGTVTCCPMGAGKWRDEYTEALRGARWVIVVSDNDEVGRAHALHVVRELRPLVDRIEAVLPATQDEKTDLSDHLDGGHALEDLRPLNGEPGEGPVFLDAYEFVRLQVESPPPLWGSHNTTIIPQAGLVLFAGRPGTGKTTFIIDLACHLAAGLPYPPTDKDGPAAPSPYPVPRPLRLALIENEGPLEMFRDKMRIKLNVFHTNILEAGGYLGIQAWRWGSFSFSDDEAFGRAAAELDALGIDLVIGDPLGMLGVEGVGSPADTREFVMKLRKLGLGTTRAFLLIHHFRERVDKTEDELSRLSGAWGPHADTIFTLSHTESEEQARLAFPKLRWAREIAPKPIILGRVYRLQGFEALGTEDDAQVLEPMLAQALRKLRETKAGYGPAGGWITYANLAKQISRKREQVRKALEGAPHLFALREGPEAKEIGAKSNAKLWGLREWDDAPGSLLESGPEPEEEPGSELPSNVRPIRPDGDPPPEPGIPF